MEPASRLVDPVLAADLMSTSHRIGVGSVTKRVDPQDGKRRYVYYVTVDGREDPTVLAKGDAQINYWLTQGNAVQPIAEGTAKINLEATNDSKNTAELWDEHDKKQDSLTCSSFPSGHDAEQNISWQVWLGQSVQIRATL